jgi:hypothetical protein
LKIDRYSLRKLSELIQYHDPFYKEKKDGSKRKIIPPTKYLKRVQRRLLSLLSRIEKPEWVVSTKGKSHIDNGRIHVNSNYMLTMDIQKFYDNCQREPVYRFFSDRLETSSDVAGV